MQDDRNAIQGMAGIGCIVGVVVINFIATIKGRVTGLKVAAFSGLVHGCLLVSGAFLRSHWMLAVSLFLGGVTHEGLLILTLLLLEKWGVGYVRVRVAIILNFFNNQLVVGLFSLVLPHWQCMAWMMLVGYIALFLLAFCLAK